MVLWALWWNKEPLRRVWNVSNLQIWRIFFRATELVIVFHQVLFLYETYQMDFWIRLVPYDWYPNFNKNFPSTQPGVQRINVGSFYVQTVWLCMKAKQPLHSFEWGEPVQGCPHSGLWQKKNAGLSEMPHQTRHCAGQSNASKLTYLDNYTLFLQLTSWVLRQQIK